MTKEALEKSADRGKGGQDRAQRLEEALRANLIRRKAQARARAAESVAGSEDQGTPAQPGDKPAQS